MCGHPPGQRATYQWPLPTPEKKRDSPYPHTITYPHPCFPAGRTSGDPLSFMIKFLTIFILLNTTHSDKYSTVSSCNTHVTAKGLPFTVSSCPLVLTLFPSPFLQCPLSLGWGGIGILHGRSLIHTYS